MFGGLQGLEAGVDADANLDVTDPSLLFDFYLNTCPSQGSRTIRTEVGQVAHGAAGVVPVHTEQRCLPASGSDTYSQCNSPSNASNSPWLAQGSLAKDSSSECGTGLFQEALLISLSALRPRIEEAVKTPTDS